MTRAVAVEVGEFLSALLVASVIPEGRAEAIASAAFELDRAATVETFVDLLTVSDA